MLIILQNNCWWHRWPLSSQLRLSQGDEISASSGLFRQEGKRREGGLGLKYLETRRKRQFIHSARGLPGLSSWPQLSWELGEQTAFRNGSGKPRKMAILQLCAAPSDALCAIKSPTSWIITFLVCTSYFKDVEMSERSRDTQIGRLLCVSDKMAQP